MFAEFEYPEKEMKSKARLATLFLFLVVFPGLASSQSPAGLIEPLAFLKPFLASTERQGQMKLPPDGSKTATVIQKYEVLWDGKVIRYTRSVVDLGFFAEGFFYWDQNEKQVLHFVVNSRGNADRGTVTLDNGLITVSGKLTMAGKTFDFRNTFEFAPDGKMVDRWFQNMTGEWNAGHVVEFAARDQAVTPAGVPAPFSDISPAQAAALIQAASPQNPVAVLDVRREEEYKEGFIKGAVLLPVTDADFKKRAAKLDKAISYLVYCKGGVRSSRAMDMMKELGFARVFSLAGGILRWTEEKFPLEKFKGRE